MLTLPQRRNTDAAQDSGLAELIAHHTNLRERLRERVGRVGQLARLQLNLTQDIEHLWLVVALLAGCYLALRVSPSDQ